jgi:hypothetical protein
LLDLASNLGHAGAAALAEVVGHRIELLLHGEINPNPDHQAFRRTKFSLTSWTGCSGSKGLWLEAEAEEAGVKQIETPELAI